MTAVSRSSSHTCAKCFSRQQGIDHFLNILYRTPHLESRQCSEPRQLAGTVLGSTMVPCTVTADYGDIPSVLQFLTFQFSHFFYTFWAIKMISLQASIASHLYFLRKTSAQIRVQDRSSYIVHCAVQMYVQITCVSVSQSNSIVIIGGFYIISHYNTL